MSEWNCWKNSSDIASGNRGRGEELRYIRGFEVGGKRERRMEIRVSKTTEMGPGGVVAVIAQLSANILPAEINVDGL